MKSKFSFLLLAVIVFTTISLGLAQVHQNEILSRSLLARIEGEVSGKISFEHVRDLGVFSRWYGSDDMEKAAEFIVKLCNRYGLTDVRKETFPVDRDTYYFMQKPWLAWNCELAELRLIEPEKRLISSYEANTTCVLVYSRDADVEAEVVYVGKGTEAVDYEGKDIKGKIVFAYGEPWEVSKIAIFRYKAAGILIGYGLDVPEYSSTQIFQMRIKPWSDDGSQQSTFGFMLSVKQARELLNYVQSGKKVLAHALVKAKVRVPGTHTGVTAIIPGTDYPDEEIVLIAHLDHPRPGAHDNLSGCATLLEVARSLKTLINQKSIMPPKRTIRFYWTPHVWGAHMFYSRYPDRLKKTIAGINVDCVGLDQMKFSTCFNVILPPYSRASWLGDVIENGLNYISLANNSAVWGQRKYAPGIYDHDGSRNVFWGRTIPFVGMSDHLFFNSGDVGIPMVMMIDLPFGAHHTQNDELWFLDPTQLKRVAFLVAVSVYTIVSSGPKESQRLIEEVYSNCMIRLEREMKLAESILYQSDRQSVQKDYAAVKNMLDHGFYREEQVLTSTAVFAKDDDEVLSFIKDRISRIKKVEKTNSEDLLACYKTRAQQLGLDAILLLEPTTDELKLKAIVPRKNPALKGDFGSLNEYLVEKYQFESIMPDDPIYYEILNLMDGKRNMLDIAQFVAAESLSANYEKPSVNEIFEYIRLLRESGIISY